MKFRIYQYDYEDTEYWEKQNGKYAPVVIEAKTTTEALKLFLSVRGWKDYGEFYAISEDTIKYLKERKERDEDYTPSSTRGDYSPANPWDAEGMSISDFI